MTVHTITIPAPGPWLTANDRRHHYNRAATVRPWRQAGELAARAARIPRLNRAHIVAYVSFGDRRRRDPLNWANTVKALVDGIVDAGVLTDDSWQYLIGPDMRIGPVIPRHPSGPRGQVTLAIRDISAAEHDPSGPYATALADVDAALAAYTETAAAKLPADPAGALGLARTALHRRVDAAINTAITAHTVTTAGVPR